MLKTFFGRFFSDTRNCAKKRLAYVLACDRSGMANGIAIEITGRIYKILNEYFYTNDSFDIAATRAINGDNFIEIRIPVKFAKNN